MNGQQLKNSILQLAIQGKLVPQDPNDEPASVLLGKIRKEKEQLVKAGKLKKKDLVCTPIADEEKPFEIPVGWEWVRFGDIVQMINGDRGKNYPSKTELSDNGYIPFISAINLNDNTVKKEGLLFVSQEQYDKLGSGKLQKGDLVLCIRGSLGKNAIYPFELGAIASSLVIIRSYLAEQILYRFLSYYFDTPLFQSEINVYNNGTAQPNLGARDLAKFLFPLPPLPEQHRIVSKIEELMPFVSEYDKAQSKLDELNDRLPSILKKSILQEAIMGKLVPQAPNDEPASALLSKIRKEKEQLVKAGKLKKKDLVSTPIAENEKPFEIPESWEWCRVGDLFSHSNGKQLNKGNAHGKMMDYITTSNLYWDYFVLDKLKQMPFEENEIEKCQAIKGDLLVCEGGDVGRAAIWDKEYPIMLQNHVHKCRSYIPMCTKYFYYIFYFYNKRNMIGGKGIGIQGFSSTALHNTLIPLPPLSEQHRIVSKIEELFSVFE